MKPLQDNICKDVSNSTESRYASVITALTSVAFFEQYGDDRIYSVQWDYLCGPADVK